MDLRSPVSFAFRQGFRLLDRMLELLVMVCMLVLVLDVVWQVIGRYVLRQSNAWTAELATFMMMWVGLLGMSVALHRGAHLGIDILTNMLPSRARSAVQIFAFVCAGAFSLFVLMIGGGTLVHRTLASGQVSPAMGIPMGYVYMALPASGFFLLLYSIRLSVTTARLMRGGAAADLQPASSTQSALNAME